MTTVFNPNPVSEEQYNENTRVMNNMVKGGSSNFGSYQEYVNSVKQRNADMIARGADPKIFEPNNQGITGGLFDNANKFVLNHLVDLNNVGTASYEKPKIMENAQSRMKTFADGRSVDLNELPVGPGNTYLTHLFKYHKIKDKMQKQKEQNSPKNNIYTDQTEALRTALSIIGCYSDRNPGGMPIEINDAKKLWFGEKEVTETDDAEFRATVEIGDVNLDPKKVRRFVNSDGSLTWEVLNDDKTVMSRFTMGDYAGTKVFAQGGYKAFAEILKKAKQQIGQDTGGQFDAIRGAYSGS